MKKCVYRKLSDEDIYNIALDLIVYNVSVREEAEIMGVTCATIYSHMAKLKKFGIRSVTRSNKNSFESGNGRLESTNYKKISNMLKRKSRKVLPT